MPYSYGLVTTSVDKSHPLLSAVGAADLNRCASQLREYPADVVTRIPDQRQLFWPVVGS